MIYQCNPTQRTGTTNVIGQHLELVDAKSVFIVQDHVVCGPTCTLNPGVTAQEKVEPEWMANFSFYQRAWQIGASWDCQFGWSAIRVGADDGHFFSLKGNMQVQSGDDSLREDNLSCGKRARVWWKCTWKNVAAAVGLATGSREDTGVVALAHNYERYCWAVTLQKFDGRGKNYMVTETNMTCNG